MPIVETFFEIIKSKLYEVISACCRLGAVNIQSEY